LENLGTAIKYLPILFLCFRPTIILSQDEIEIKFLKEYTIHAAGPYGEVKYLLTALPSTANKDSLRAIIKKELQKYPLGVLTKKARLKTILVVDRLGKFAGDSVHHQAAGTYCVPLAAGNIIIVSGTVPIMPAAIHHEISSVFLEELAHNNAFYEQKAISLLRRFQELTEYTYKNPELSAVLEVKHEWPKNKDNFFVLGNSGYGLVDYENDYNTIVEFLFTPKLSKALGTMLVDSTRTLWGFLSEAKKDKYPIYEKVMMVIDYYNSIDPHFTETYFRKFEN
jgi:hypothetical protein